MSAYASYADAYRLRAQYHAAMAHAARCDADLPPMRRAEAIAHHEAQAAFYADRAARFDADALGEAA